MTCDAFKKYLLRVCVYPEKKWESNGVTLIIDWELLSLPLSLSSYWSIELLGGKKRREEINNLKIFFKSVAYHF